AGSSKTKSQNPARIPQTPHPQSTTMFPANNRIAPRVSVPPAAPALQSPQNGVQTTPTCSLEQNRAHRHSARRESRVNHPAPPISPLKMRNKIDTPRDKNMPQPPQTTSR